MKKDFTSLILIVVLVVGLSLLLYPTFSNYWNDLHQTKAIANYVSAVDHMKKEDFTPILDSAADYNESLTLRSNPYLLTEIQAGRYEQELNVSGDGIMGYIEIPCIQVQLPLYHGTSDVVLQVAIGHLDWTSLPVGGESTHCVVSGHRGLPSARLFTDLDKMAVGDTFLIHVLGEMLTYEVDQIKIVEPHETEDLLIQQGKDLVTLVTCTPYGINSHRLLVRGHRVENAEQAVVVRVTADAIIIDKLIVVPFLLAPMLLVALLSLLIPRRKKKSGPKV